VVGGILLGVSLFLAWYGLGNQNAVLNGCRGPNRSCTAWSSLSVVRFLLLIAAASPGDPRVHRRARVTPSRGPEASSRRSPRLAALTLTVFRGVIERPGTPSGEISVHYGWWVAVLGGLLILVGSVWRSQESATRRKPPGVL